MRIHTLCLATALICSLSISGAKEKKIPGNQIPYSYAEGPSESPYLDIMQTAVEAYLPDHIHDYIRKVETVGITEHGFARLTSNLGILIARGRLKELTPTFLKMMDLCVKEIPVARQKNKGEIGNDFAVKEICCCIMELEAAGTLPEETIRIWRSVLSRMKAKTIYSSQPKIGDARAHNWCVFGAASECARLCAGIGGDRFYADRYLTDQLRFFDENGMFKDPHQPMVYDFVTRLQYMAALNLGYDGPAKAEIERQLLKSAEPTLLMQSVSGEIPFGGRSNQFLHNDTFYAAVCEYYASWMKKLGRNKDAARFKAAALKALEGLAYWTGQKPVRHVKNRYPTSTGYGCEGYAHYNKYMVTMASWAYLAWRFADDSIKPAPDREKNSVFVTSEAFHRVILNAGGYTAQWDLNAQKGYDCNGLGRIQKAGAPPVIAIAAPCPSALKSSYKLDIPCEGGLSVSPEWNSYSIKRASKGILELTNGRDIWTSRLSRKGLEMTLSGEGMQSLTLPALEFDGETHSVIECDGKTLNVRFNGWRCRYETDGDIIDTGRIHANRNGHLHRFEARATGKLKVKVSIVKE